MMNEQIIQNLATDAMITGGIMGVCFTIAIGILVNLAWASRQRQTDRMYRLEDEVRKLRTSVNVLEIDKKYEV
jgi:HAMP domain-containing protein